LLGGERHTIFPFSLLHGVCAWASWGKRVIDPSRISCVGPRSIGRSSSRSPYLASLLNCQPWDLPAPRFYSYRKEDHLTRPASSVHTVDRIPRPLHRIPLPACAAAQSGAPVGSGPAGGRALGHGIVFYVLECCYSLIIAFVQLTYSSTSRLSQHIVSCSNSTVDSGYQQNTRQ
jgi:hypothetical protein